MISRMKNKRVTLTVFMLIAMTAAGEAVANLLLKKGLNDTGIHYIYLNNMTDFLIKSFSSPFIWIALLVFLINFFIWITVLSRIDLSVAFPICSISYIFVPMLAVVFLHETMNLARWLGIIFIIAGVSLVSRSANTAKIT